jgi:FKBP-type peptidyl-prolyl cis-trans isomerase
MKYKYIWLILSLCSCQAEVLKQEKLQTTNFEKSPKISLNQPELKSKKIIDKIKLENGIKINYYEKGSGEFVKDRDVLKINYEVYLENGTFVDGNKLLNKPWFPFMVGFEMQTKGWDIALKSLRVGDFVEIFLPSKMARGEIGIKGLIPPNADNYIKIKIVDKIKPTREIDGTKVWVLEESKFEKLKATTENIVEFHYMISTPSNPKYDVSYRKNLPYTLKFSDFGIVKGLKKALINAKKSDKTWVLIPPTEAYGSRGLQDLVKANEYLFYDLFIMDVR